MYKMYKSIIKKPDHVFMLSDRKIKAVVKDTEIIKVTMSLVKVFMFI